MAFRGKEWLPPDKEQVASFIQDRLSLTELSMESLKEVLSTAQFDVITGEGLDLDEIIESNDAVVNDINRSYYTQVKKLATTVDKKELVNIVLPVYNSIHLTRECLDAVLKNTYWPYHVTIVDDASDAYTNAELAKIVAANPDKMTLLTNKKNRGFAATVNRGVRSLEATSKYTCYLNSDVLVTPYWLTKMVTALNADPRNKIVNPVTNNTAVINVGMNAGFTYQAMNEALERKAVRRYPEVMPTGFCFLFPNSLIQSVGYLDEAYANFGEETDFWMRTITYSDGKTYERWRAILADDTYVFHQRGASYATLGEEQHMNLRKTASAKFRTSWPGWTLWNKSIDSTTAVQPLKKKRTAKDLSEILANAERPSVCFVTHSVETCGGMHYIADIVNQINANGGDARVAVILRDNKAMHEPVAELRTAPVVFESADKFVEEFTTKVFNNGVVIAATSELAEVVAKVCEPDSKLIPVLHVQSYEPSLVGNDTELSKKLETNFDFIPNIISSSSWITKELGRPVLDTINPGVDRDIFYPGNRAAGDERPTVMISLNGRYPFKGADRGCVVAKYLTKMARAKGREIRILGVGATSVNGLPEVICQGNMARTRIAKMLATEVDVFVDPAFNHSYGMPALEAIACGALVVGWDNRGIREYLPKNYGRYGTIMPNDTQPKVIAEMIYDFLFNDAKRLDAAAEQRKVAMIDAHNRKLGVSRFIDCVQTKFSVKREKKSIVVVTPHLRKHGGPTTIVTMANELAARGHDVKIATVYSDVNPQVAKYTDLPILLLNQDPSRVPACDLLITNSDNPLNPAFATKCPQAIKKIMLKLSHNPRFKQLEEQGLQLKWDAVVTSSQWLADVCENPTPGWNYPPCKATRVGWFHYNFASMRRNTKKKRFNTLNAPDPVVLTTLIHGHESKGSAQAGNIFLAIKKAYGDKVKLYGVGELNPNDVKIGLAGMEYVYAPSRAEMADLMFRTDIWLSCSHSEGLGRMALEAMTGAAACVLTDTKAEFVVPDMNALVAPVGDLDALAEACNSLIQDVELRKKIAINGFATAKEMADSTEFTDELEKVIAGVF